MADARKVLEDLIQEHERFEALEKSMLSEIQTQKEAIERRVRGPCKLDRLVARIPYT